VHPFSQKAHCSMAADCALFLCLLSPSVNFKALAIARRQEAACWFSSNTSMCPGAGDLRPPRHAEMLRAIYATWTFSGPAIAALRRNGRRRRTGVHRQPDPVAQLRPHPIDATAGYRRRHPDQTGELCLQRWDVIHLALNLSDPLTPDFAAGSRNSGFSLPVSSPRAFLRDALILQYLNTAGPITAPSGPPAPLPPI